jgi:alpha-beta hydrolase superfamily lysophospholipase
MMTLSEGTATGSARASDVEVRSGGGVALKGRWWRRTAPRGVVVIAHGYGEHGGAYRRVAEAIGSQLDCDVVAVDFRGHGRSPGRRGVVRSYDELTEDLTRSVEWARRQVKGVNCFVLGHSNGGQVALRMALEASQEISGLVLSNPVLRIAVNVPRAKLAIGRFLARRAPWVTLRGALELASLTGDPESQAEHRSDPLRHSRMSAPLFFGMIEGGDTLLHRAGELKLRFLLLVGGKDTVTDPEAAREFFDRAGSEDKTLSIYPRMLHEPLNDVGREQVIEDVVRWLESKL